MEQKPAATGCERKLRVKNQTPRGGQSLGVFFLILFP